MYRDAITRLAVSVMLPALATAEVTLDVVSGAHPGPYTSSLDGSGFGPGSVFILWTVIHTDQALDGVQYRLHVNNDAANHKFDLIGYATGPLTGYEVFFGKPDGSFAGLGGVFSGGFTDQNDSYPTRKDEFGLNVLPSGLNALATSEVIHDTAGLAFASALNNKTVIGYVIQANADFTVGNYVFSALGAQGGSSYAIWTASGQSPANGPITEGASFTLTPEPTSALLLLAAVPFLRRRRA